MKTFYRIGSTICEIVVSLSAMCAIFASSENFSTLVITEVCSLTGFAVGILGLIFLERLKEGEVTVPDAIGIVLLVIREIFYKITRRKR